MMRALAALLLTTISVVAFSQRRTAPASLIRTGAFHGDEVSARSGERWIGLTPSIGGFEWRTFELTTRRVEDVVVDAPGEKTGVEVTVRGGRPVFLVKEIPGLLGKVVRTAVYSPEGLALPDKDALELYCGPTPGCGSYKLRVTDRKMADDAPDAPSRLVLESSDGLQQTLFEWPHGLRDEHCELIWAGDLDGDGKLDLFMDLSGHYNVMDYTLFLSSVGSNGKLVKRVAIFHTVGC